MRSLPGARSLLVLCLLFGGPALTAVVTSPQALAAGSTVAAGPTVARGSGTAAPHPVPTKIVELALTGAGSRFGQASELSAAASAPAVLTPARHTAAFQTVGVTWAAIGPGAAEPELLISVRTHPSAAAKGWSSWAELDDDAGEDDPDGAEAARPGVRGGTDPLWVGESDGVQTRIVLRSGTLPKDLKLELVNPGSSGYDAVASAAIGSAAVGGSASGVAEPLILSRAAWGADESKVRYSPTYMPTVKAAVLHHTAGPNKYSPAQVPSIIRGDYAYHLSRGWSDIGYNALVDRFGRIWEGRAGGLQHAVMGAHAGGFNTDTFGVSMIGNYDVARPSAAAITAVTRVLAWKLDLNHRNPFGRTRLTSAGGGTARFPAGRTVTFPVIMGHRNTGRTACPGRYLYPYLPSIRTRVAALMKAALLDPAGPPASVQRATPVTVGAGVLSRQSWRLDVVAPCGAGRVARITGVSAAGRRLAAVWDGRLADGSPARPGRYTLTLTSTGLARGTAAAGPARARPVVYRVLVLPPAPIPVPAGTPSSGPGGYLPVTPTRLLDTSAPGGTGIGPAGRIDVAVLGRAGVPSTGVSAVVLNLTAGCISDDTSLTVWPAGAPASNRPVTGLLAGGTDSVLVTVRVGANGAVSIGNARGVLQLSADLVGYYGPGGSLLQAIDGTRIYDSRTDPTGPLPAGQARLIPLPQLLDGVDVGRVKAVLVDVSALNPAGVGSLVAYRPGSSGALPTLSYGKGGNVDNLAIVEVSGGAIAVRADGTGVDALLEVRALVLDDTAVDPSGSRVGTAFTATKPTLVLDTRTTGGAITAGNPRKLVLTRAVGGVPADARAVLLAVTGLAPSTSTWLQVYPTGETPTAGGAVRVSAGATRGNLVLVPLGADGAIELSNGRGRAQVRIDVHGYLGPATG